MASTSLPFLSVVVPNYNHANHLETCLSAILRQSVQPLEVIVLDDASTDNSVEILQRYVAQYPVIRLVENQKNLGVIPNVNKGVALARGEYVHVAPADDEVMQGFFEESLRLLAQYPQAALCCAVTEWREVASGLTWQMATRMGNKPCYITPDEMVRMGKRGELFIVTSSCIQKKEALLKAGLYPPELRWHADWFAMYVTGFRDGICFVPEILSTANILPGSFYQSGHKKCEHEKVLVKLLDLLNSERCADVAPRIRESGALSMFAMPLLRLMLRRPEYRHFITPTFLQKTLRRSAELKAKKCFPTWLARWCLNRFYRFRKAPKT